MTHNPVRLLAPMINDAGFQQVHGGNLHPWIRYVHGVKPAAECPVAPATPEPP